MQPIAEYNFSAHPDRCSVEIYDADAYLADEAAMKASRQQVVAGNGYHLYVHSLQSDIQVGVRIRIWPMARDIPGQAEGFTPVSLESETGILVIGQLTLGPAGEMELPRAGLYEGIASWTGREAVAAYHDDILRQIDDDWGVEEISRAWRECPFTEEYVLDLSFSRPSTPDED
ncbi:MULTISPECIES: hypothetical protein [Streptomyces]|uniref:Uncharacterized protein n=2 Tax=Streptomyces TaxID=1883 RepID=A0A1E7LIH6_9ACTN|nr:hypothetical protein AN221_35060 [Streptomyces nanshensis]